MTIAAAKAKGYAVAVKGSFGWAGQCTSCRWEQPPEPRRYYSDASFASRAHNAEFHPEAKA